MSNTWNDDGSPGIGLLAGGAGAPAPGVRTATVSSAGGEGGLRVSYEPDGTGVSFAARTTVAVSAADVGRSVVVALEEGDPARPIVLGILREAAPQPEEEVRLLAPAGAPEVSVDGKRVCVEGEDEVVLRCGEASISLRKDGRITIRGMEIVSRARGTHKVKGATVLIN